MNYLWRHHGIRHAAAAFTPATGLLAQFDLLRCRTRGALTHVRLNRAGQAQRAQRHADSATAHAFRQPARSDARGGAQRRGRPLLRRARPVGADASAASPRACCTRACGTPRSTRCSSAACRWSRCCTARWSAAGSSSPSAATSASPRRSAYYGLPEGQRGLFVGGGGSARMPRLIGVARMTDMMLTGRVSTPQEGQHAGLSQYLVADGRGPGQGASSWRARSRGNAPLSNFAVMHALPRIADLSQSDGLFVESLMAAIAAGRRRRQGAHARLPRRPRRQGGARS